MRDKTTMSILRGIDKRDGLNRTNEYFNKTNFSMLKQFFPYVAGFVLLIYLNKILSFFNIGKDGLAKGAFDVITGSSSQQDARDFQFSDSTLQDAEQYLKKYTIDRKKTKAIAIKLLKYFQSKDITDDALSQSKFVYDQMLLLKVEERAAVLLDFGINEDDVGFNMKGNLFDWINKRCTNFYGRIDSSLVYLFRYLPFSTLK